uniref:Uncharacterized protein n=1 Tax=Magallana gigas TaxID=29159 RepID=A0A8W8NUC9_MAGGI
MGQRLQLNPVRRRTGRGKGEGRGRPSGRGTRGGHSGRRGLHRGYLAAQALQERQSDSAAARAVKMEHGERNRTESESVIRIKTQAERSVKALGGDVKNVKHLLEQRTIQFGQFRGMTFKWLLENPPGWVALDET